MSSNRFGREKWRTAKLNTARADRCDFRSNRTLDRSSSVKREDPSSTASVNAPVERASGGSALALALSRMRLACARRARQSASRRARLEGSAPSARGERRRNDGGDVRVPRPVPPVRSSRPARPAFASRASPKPKPVRDSSPTPLPLRALTPPLAPLPAVPSSQVRAPDTRGERRAMGRPPLRPPQREQLRRGRRTDG